MTEEAITIHEGENTEVEVPAEIEEKAAHFIDNYKGFLKERTEAYKHRAAEPQAEAGGPVLASGYQYWNCLLVGPIQFYRDPPYRPSNIIAGGEASLMLGIVWINPANGPGGSLPGTVVFGGRKCNWRFETINLSHVQNEPNKGGMLTLDNPAKSIYIFRWWRTWPNPGYTPNLYETYFTADIVEAGQPFAAFSTWHYSIDREPGFLAAGYDVPSRPPGMYEGPARFLVYEE
jgi:hypothetical protein